MANAATMPKPAATAAKAPAVAPVPFTRAAKEHIEPFTDESILLTASTQQRGPFDIPAYGYARALLLFVQATAGNGTGATTAAFEDAPWNVFQQIAINDVNGAPIVGPFSGFDLYLVNKYGGYKFMSDPRQQPTFSAPAAGVNASGNFSFALRIPLEISGRDGLGSLSNQNASSTYKLAYVLNASTVIYTTPPATTLPTVRVRAQLEAWSQPTGSDLRNVPQATTPPSEGTTSYWSKQIFAIVNGQQTIRFARMGNYVRMWILIMRDAAGTPVRSGGAALFPDPAQFFWDTRLLHNFIRAIFQQYMAERYGFAAAAEAAGGLDNGVFVYEWAHEFDQKVGNELGDGWVPTTQSTRFELQGNFTGAGNLTVITNDVAPAGDVFVR